MFSHKFSSTSWFIHESHKQNHIYQNTLIQVSHSIVLYCISIKAIHEAQDTPPHHVETFKAFCRGAELWRRILVWRSPDPAALNQLISISNQRSLKTYNTLIYQHTPCTGFNFFSV